MFQTKDFILRKSIKGLQEITLYAIEVETFDGEKYIVEVDADDENEAEIIVWEEYSNIKDTRLYAIVDYVSD